jgi:RNA polymerase sigma factor (TIGR02999 family)
VPQDVGEDIRFDSTSVWVAPMNEVTRVLSAIEGGDAHAAEQLLPLVYDELRKLAATQLAQEKPGQTLDATALVHEAYLRLVGDQHFETRRHFFAAAAAAMRRILVENARRKRRRKHGGQFVRRPLDQIDVAAPDSSDDLLALQEALQMLTVADAIAAQLVELRFFAGMTIPQAAELMNLSPRKADRLWAYARAFLHSEIYSEK